MRCRENRKRDGEARVNKDMSCKLANGLIAVGLAAGPAALVAACMAAAPTINVCAAQNTAENNTLEQSAQNARYEAEKEKNAAEENYNQAVEAAESAGVTAETAAAAEAEAKTAKFKEKEAADASAAAQTAAEKAAEAVSIAEAAEQDALGKKKNAGEDRTTAERNVTAAQTAYDTAEQTREDAEAKADPSSVEYATAAQNFLNAQKDLDAKKEEKELAEEKLRIVERNFKDAEERARKASEAMEQMKNANDDASKIYDELEGKAGEIREYYKAFGDCEREMAALEYDFDTHVLQKQEFLDTLGADSDEYKGEERVLNLIQTEIADVKARRDTYSAYYEEMRTNYPEAAVIFDAAIAAMEEAYDKYERAKTANDDAMEDVAYEEEMLNNRKKDAETAQKHYQDAEKDVNTAREIKDKLASDLEDAQKAAAEAKEDLDKAKQALEEAKEAYEKAADAYSKESDALTVAKEELEVRKKAWEDAENAVSEARKLAQKKAQEAADQKSLYDAVIEAQNALAAALDNLRSAIAKYQETGDSYTLSYIRQTLDEIGDQYGITISEVIRRDVSGMSEEAAEKNIIEALSEAWYAQWFEFDVGERTIIPGAVVSGIMKVSNDVYFDFIYMGYRWTVKLPSRDVLRTLLNADGTLDLLTFISETNKAYIVRIAPV